MFRLYRPVFIAFAFFSLVGFAVAGPISESSIGKRIDELSTMPDAGRPAAILQLAKDIQTLPAGAGKVKVANNLAHQATAGDPGQDTLQAVADTLAQALAATPQPPAKNGDPADAYMELAKMVRYEQVAVDLKDPMLGKADEILTANDADAAKADFTLKDIEGKKVTLSALRGKIVLVNFWGTICQSCKKEMADLDLIYTHFQSQGLAILSVAAENDFRVGTFLRGNPGTYHPTVLIDSDSKVTKQFHVDNLPRAFVFDRDGKLVAESMDMRTQKQLFQMLAKAGLHP
jgi:peroxiredoxin